MSLLPSDVELGVFYAAFLAWLVFTFVVERMIRGGGAPSAERTRGDRGSGLLIYLSVFASIVVAFSLAGAGVALLPEWTFFLGIPLMFAGMAVRAWAIMTLRGFFLFRVGVLRDHRVVETGPYSRVRHPSYGGAIITMAGMGLAVQSLAALLMLLLFCGVAYWYRIRVEEKAMLNDLGEPYAEYMGRTKRLIPFDF